MMMDCRTARSLMEDWERGELVERERLEALLGHVASCTECGSVFSALAPLIRRDIAQGRAQGRAIGGAEAAPPSEAARRLADSVMSAIAQEPRPRRAEGGRGSRAEARVLAFGGLGAARIGMRSIAIGAAGIAAALVLGLGLGLFLGPRDADLVTVRFVLEAPEAGSVALAGDFTDWRTEGYELRRVDSGGSWSISLKLKKDKLYTYNFVVDGERWIIDPSIPETVDDGFGGASTLLHL